MHLRTTLRALRRSPWYTLTAIGTIALSISLAATVFAVVDGVLFKPLPYPDADRLYFAAGDGGPREGTASLAPIDVRDLRAADPRIGVTAVGSGGPQTALPDEPDKMIAFRGVEANFFDVLRVHPLAGGFSTEHFATEPSPGAPIPAVITYAWWKDKLGGETSILGRTIDLIGHRVVVAGVLPRDFLWPFGTPPDALVPLVVPAAAQTDRWRRSLSMIVRLRHDITFEEGHAKLDAALAAHTREYPPRQNVHPGPYIGVSLRPVQTALGRRERPLFGIAFSGAALLVLLGGINVAGLIAAHGRDRQRELSIRLAVGATRAHLVRLMLAEALAIAVCGGAIGVWLVVPLLEVTRTLMPATLVLLKPLEIDWRVIAFSILTPALTVTTFSVIPALRSARGALAQQMTAGVGATTRVRSWGRAGLIATENAIGGALVLAGSLILASFVAVRAADPGIDSDRLSLIQVRSTRTLTLDERRVFYGDVLFRLQRAAGVERAAMIGIPLLENSFGGFRFKIPPGAVTIRGVSIQEVPISSDFFVLAGLRVLDGRVMTPSEIDAGRPYAVVSETLARTWWPGQRAVGQTLSARDDVTVIGVVEDARYSSQDAKEIQIYVPIDPMRPVSGAVAYLLRTSGHPDAVVKQTALTLQKEMPGVLIPRAESFDAALFKSVRAHQFRTVLFGVAGGAALLLLAVGVGGLVAANTARRAREIGIRTALGARRRQLELMVVVEHLRPSLAGLALGLLLSWWTTKLVSAFLYEIDAHEPAVWTAAAGVVLAIVAIAAWIPARRAASVDPMVALRTE